MSTRPLPLGKLLAIVVSFFLIGFLGLSYLLGLSYCDDRIPLTGNHPAPAQIARSIGNLASDAPLEMQVRFALRHRDSLEKLLKQQHDPKSSSYHKWLTTEEFFRRFGPTKPEVKALSEWLAGEGFNVNEVAASHLSFSGNVAQTQRTFAVTIARFGSGNAYANLADPFIPARFANVVGAVTGMDNMMHAAPASQAVNGGNFDPQAIISGSQAFGPGDFRTFYNENPGPGKDGDGDCIAIVGMSDFLDSTMSAFTTQFGLPPISYTRVVHGSNPGINGAEVEAELDLQWAHAAAPAASIAYHFGGNLVDDITAAVNDNQCGAISISYGFCGPSPEFINTIIHPLFQQAAAQGQSVFVSSGDQGSAGLGYDPFTNSCVAGSSPSVNEMSADPNVTSVGGTQFAPKFASGNDQGYTNEAAWNDGSGATGGGASQVFAKPDYQTGPGVPNDGARDVPDVSLMASPNAPGAFFGHDVSGTGQVVCCIGGTSLSAPLWGAFSRVLAEIVGQQRLGNLNTIIYQLANTQYATAGFHDVTNGNNGFNHLVGFNAAPGFDLATGWGTVNFDAFADAARLMLSPSATPTPAPTPIPSTTPTPSPSATATPVGGVLNVPAKVNFPSTATGKPGSMKPLVVRNLSRTAPLDVELGELTAPFALSGPSHYTIAPASSVSIPILFSPIKCETVQQSLKITSGDPKHPAVTVQVIARVQGGKLKAPARVAMTAALAGSVVTKTVILKNSGAGMLSGSAQGFGPDAPFSLLGGPVTFWLAPGQTQPVTIQFQPETVGQVQSNLAIAMVEPAGSASIQVMGVAR